MTNSLLIFQLISRASSSLPSIANIIPRQYSEQKGENKCCLNEKDDWLDISFGLVSGRFKVSSTNEQLRVSMSTHGSSI